MTREQLQQCHTRAMAAAGRLRLPLRSRVWRGQAGEFTGGGTGSSLDFQDHRSYLPGDDPRHINWQAYARTGHYTMKLFREEVRPVVDLVFDVSESMFFDPVKATRSAELFYFLAESAHAAAATLGLHAVRGNTTARIDPETLCSHRWLENVRQLPVSGDLAAPDLSRLPLHANAVRVFISDLLFPGDPEPLLRHLGQRHGSILLFAPYLESEANPSWSGNYEFIDAENQSHHQHRIEPHTLKRYLDAYAAHMALWKHAARRHQAAFARIPAEADLSNALFAHALPAGALETHS
ncbi:MAG TPA: DUF58 domain-containing protein [Luteolibacter sp.]